MTKDIRGKVLYFDNCSTAELAKEYGTPLYIMSQTEIENRMREIRACFTDKYPNTRAAYASKAFCTTAMYKLCEREGFCIDIVSGGELYTAIKAGFPADRIEFNGNNKLPEEIEQALDYGIGRFIVDGLQEIELIESICREKGKTANVLFRVTPGVAASTHDYITTGKKDSKFGIPLDEDVFYPQVEAAIEAEHINFLGIHFHVGSQLFDNTPYLQALDIILDKVSEIKKRFGYDIKELNLGGGFGAVYIDEQRMSYEYFLEPLMQRIEEFSEEHGMDRPAVVIEPGRSIVAEAGISLYTIGSIKDIRDIRKYVSVDGGMGDNIRPALYQAEYEGIVANKADEPQNDKVTICGKCCESGDILMKDCMITDTAEAGDLLAMFSTGAYGFSMASNYNSNPIPAVVLVKNGKSEIIVKRQSYEDLISRHQIPSWL